MTTDLMRLDTLTPSVNLVRSMDRLMDQFFGPALWSSSSAVNAYDGTLPVDISETESAVVVRASLPGYRREDIEVQLHQGVLSIKATHDWQEAIEAERFHRRERAIGPVSRRIALPGVVHDSAVEAELRDGVLTLRIPIPAQARPRHIEIKSA